MKVDPMGEAKRRRERRETIGEHIGLRPGEPMVLKFFGLPQILDLAAKIPQGLDEEDQERIAAFRTVTARATSDNPPDCLICRDRTIYPALMGMREPPRRAPFS
jgi:hypothetical protein